MLNSLPKTRSRFFNEREMTLPAWSLRLVWMAYICVLFVMTHIPVPERLSEVTSNWDKIIHCGAYAVLSVLTCLVQLQNGSRQIPVPKIACALLVYAAFDEILQGLVGRTPDARDWLADCAGILMGIVVMKGFLKLAEISAIPDWASRLLLNTRSIDPAVK